MVDGFGKLDWNEYLDVAASAVAEGIVLLKNAHRVLPLTKGQQVAVFGRIQLHYYKSGTGSGGMVNVTKVTDLVEGLTDAGVKVNQTLLDVYRKWDGENPFDVGAGWGLEPWCQKEMPLEDSLVAQVAQETDTAIVVIGRTAGEEQDNHAKEGSYLLTSEELKMLHQVRQAFEKVVVLFNVGNIMDLSQVEAEQVDGIAFVWQGGMTGGTGTARVLTGQVSPSGKLTDTICYQVSDYPADKNFGDPVRNFYQEDIYVGYRYFETVAKTAVRYPFGYGLSYTSFDVQAKGSTRLELSKAEAAVTIQVTVKNTGDYAGKEVVQIYCEAPQGKLGKAARVLCGYHKTRELDLGEEESFTIEVPPRDYASYDDSGVTGHRFCYLLEQGRYQFYAGTDVRSATPVCAYVLPQDLILQECQQAMAPVEAFERMKMELRGDQVVAVVEPVPENQVDMEQRRQEGMPQELAYKQDQGITLQQVQSKEHTMDEFIAQFSDEDLSCIIRGEGMNSPKVTSGTAAAFGGVSSHLRELGIPCACCDDGPSGMRLDCGTKAFSLPNGTMLACSFNDDLIQTLYALVGKEMVANHVECLLGPGMNIHRHPLNGRNFEYFSEDPFLTGKIAAAQLRGIQSSQVTGTIKHFCGNNQETHRHTVDAVVSERALREIYLRGFEIAVKEGNANSVMTTYGSVNGLWTAGNYDLTTQILRKEWGFQGIVMTDWWANINRRNQPVDKSDFAAMVMAQNDLYMVCANGENHEDNTLASLADGSLRRAELQRCAKNICTFLLDTCAMKRKVGNDVAMEILHKPVDESDVDESMVACYALDWEGEVDLHGVCSNRGTNFSCTMEVLHPGYYEVTITASSTQGELAQIPVTLFSMGTAYGTMTWNGTNGKPVSFSKEILMGSRFTMIRLYFGQGGLNLESMRFKYVRELENF